MTIDNVLEHWPCRFSVAVVSGLVVSHISCFEKSLFNRSGRVTSKLGHIVQLSLPSSDALLSLVCGRRTQLSNGQWRFEQ